MKKLLHATAYYEIDDSFALRDAVQTALGALTDRESLVLKRLFLEGYNEREISEKLGVSQTRIHQNKSLALRKLRSRRYDGTRAIQDFDHNRV